VACKFDLDRRHGRRCGEAIASRRHQHLSKAICRRSQIPAPTVDQARRHVGPTRHVADYCTGFERRRDNRLLLLDAPPATPLGTGQYLDTRHCTVSCTGANTAVCTGTYQPDQLEDRKTAFGGGLR
jgi:hypothetical protein